MYNKYGVYAKELPLLQEGDPFVVTVQFKNKGVISKLNECDVFLRFRDYTNKLLFECSTVKGNLLWCDEYKMFGALIDSYLTVDVLGRVGIDLFVVSKLTNNIEHASEIVPIAFDYRLNEGIDTTPPPPLPPPVVIGDFNSDFSDDFSK